MSPEARPSRPFANLAKRLLWAPLTAVPFAIFFGTIMGGRRIGDFVGAWLVSLIMALGVSLTLWVTEFGIMPVLEKRRIVGSDSPGFVVAIYYVVAAVLGTYLSALLIHFTIFPQFLASVRSIITMGMFAVLFAVLFTGIGMAIYYYKESLARARAEQELTLARRIQRSFLLTQFPELPRIELHALNLSSKEVSGDFYDVVPDGQGGWLLAIADVAGKGVPAALLTSMLQASLRTQAGVTRSVAAILANINRVVYRSTAVNQFATFFLAHVDERQLTLSFSNAGHNWPVVFRDDGEREFLVKGGVVVGILEDASFEEATVALKPGDRLVLYTDGVSEAQAPSGELFGEERLYELIASLPRELSAREVTDRIVARVNEFLGGAEAGDDITLMVMRVREPAGTASAAAAGASAPDSQREPSAV
jgi:hypothetical protein